MELHFLHPRRYEVLRNGPLMTLMAGHFTVDTYSGLLPVLYPLLIERFSLDFKTVGLVSLAYTGVASLAQPFFGWIADRYGTRFIGLALIWTATLFATIGFAPSFPILLVLAAAAGLGSGAYHPLGAMNANAVISEKQRNTAMAIYASGGTIGFALGPLIGAVLFTFFGMRGTALMVLPGVSIALWLLFSLRAATRAVATRPAAPSARAGRIPLIPLMAVLGVMMARTWTVFSVEAFIPTWYASLGYDAAFYGPLATTVILTSAFGTVGLGSLADRLGGRTVTIITLIATIPAILLFAQFPGPAAFLTGALFGFTTASTGPLMLVMAQRLMAGRVGMASGLVLGLGFVTSAVGVPITGAFADAFGIQAAIRAQVLVVLATIALAWFLPDDRQSRGASSEA